MSIWIVILAATAFGGALVLWHGVSSTKHSSEEMLAKYADMLAHAREQKVKGLAEEEEEERQQHRKQAEAESRRQPPPGTEPA